MTAKAELLWITASIAELRVWENEQQKYGDPYYLGALVKLVGFRTIQISLVDKPIRRVHWLAIIKMCKREGIKKIQTKRFRFGQEREHTIEVK